MEDHAGILGVAVLSSSFLAIFLSYFSQDQSTATESISHDESHLHTKLSNIIRLPDRNINMIEARNVPATASLRRPAATVFYADSEKESAARFKL